MSSVLGLKVRPSRATVLPRASPPSAWMTLRPIARLRASFTLTTDSTIRSGAWCVLGGLEQSERVLGEAGAAIAGAGMEEFGADPVVEADAARHVLDVGADRLAQIGHLVDEGDLGGEEGVGGIFDQLGGAPAGDERAAPC